MHIVHIITKLEMGGAQKVCLALKEALELKGLSTGLITGTEGELVPRAHSSPTTILMDELTREVSAGRFFGEIVCFCKLVRILRALKRHHPDLIVHTHSTKAGLIGRWAAVCAGIKKRVHTIHGYGFHNHQNFLVHFVIYTLELVTSFITTHYVCVSTLDARRGLRIFPRFARKHSIIRAAVSCQHFQASGMDARTVPQNGAPFVFGTCGCLRKGKNHIELFKAFERVHRAHPATRLEILGDGILRAEYERWIADHGLGNAIVLSGWHHDVVPIMKLWHAFVFSSLWEGMPCSIVEARLLRLPVITYQTGGVADVIVHGCNGFIHPQHDWEGLAESMNMLLHNATLYERLANHPDDLSAFSVPVMAERHVELYHKLSMPGQEH